MAAEHSRHVRLIGLQVRDDELYARYRAEMTPILKRYGGDFSYDFSVSRVLKSESPGPINRLFTMVFPDAPSAERFFADEEYRAVRAQYFEPSVTSVTTIARFDV